MSEVTRKTTNLGPCYVCKSTLRMVTSAAPGEPPPRPLDGDGLIFCPHCHMPNKVVLGDVISLRRMTDEELEEARRSPELSDLFRANLEKAGAFLRSPPPKLN